MKYQELLVLLPCHSLDDFPTHHEGDEANSLLASWSALWHPALIASAGVAPSWRRVDDPPQELAGRLLTVPTICVPRLPTGYSQRAKEEGAVLIRKTLKREEIVALALAGLDTPPTIDAELVADFLALGYAFLTVQLLTRQTRYSTNLDEAFFNGQLIVAANAAAEGNETLARDKLSVCFNLLAEEREHYFPVDVFLIDITLVAATTLGAALRQEVADQRVTNLLIPANVLAELATKEPTTRDAIRSAVAAETVGLIGGGLENRWPLLSLETVLDDLLRGQRLFTEHFGRPCQVFGRSRYGLTPFLPSLLTKLGFTGAVHTNFEDGSVPEGTQVKVRWESLDDRAIEALARPPLDATAAETFLQYANKLGQVLDSDQSATLVFAHWPGQGSDWLNDVRRTAKYSRALGDFQTIEHFFANSAAAGMLDRFEPDRYKSPYMKQAIIRRQEDPVTTNARYWKQTISRTALATMRTLTTAVAGKPLEPNRGTEVVHEETAAEDNSAALQTAADRWAAALTGKPAVAAEEAAGFLVLNPLSHVRRVGVELPELASLPVVGRPIYAVGESSDSKQVVVDVPGHGFVWVPRKGGGSRGKDPLLAEDNVLRNEFFEAVINPVTGALSAIREYNSRGNRMSAQLALRIPGAKQQPGEVYRDPDEAAIYTVMGADSVTTTVSTPALGEIVVTGRLMDLNGQKLAGYTQIFRLWRGSRVLQMDVELEPTEEPKADPWNAYYCVRFAWADDAAEIFRTLHQTRVPCGTKKFEASHYFEIANEKQRMSILTGGLPFHRRHDNRMVDTILITRHERQRRFRLGIGVDLSHPLLEATALLAPTPVVPCAAAPASGTSGWLFHIDARNVIATHWEPVVEGERVVGVRVRLLETEGRGAKGKISAFRPLKSAKRVDLQGEVGEPLTLENDAAKVDLGPYDWQQVELRWC